MSIARYSNYRAFLRDKLAENRGIRGYRASIAAAAQCSRSYLSQVLAERAELTHDHAAGLCEFWRLSPAESEYFLSLLDLDRAKSPALKRFAQTRLDRLKQDLKEVTKRVRAEKPHADFRIEAQVAYYSHWLPAAIHILLCVPAFRTSSALAKRLGSPVHEIEAVLAELVRLGLATPRAGGWMPLHPDLNLPASSPLRAVNHANWRRQAAEHSSRNVPESVHCTCVMALGHADAEWMRERISALFIELRERAVVSRAETDAFCMNFDFFRV